MDVSEFVFEDSFKKNLFKYDIWELHLQTNENIWNSWHGAEASEGKIQIEKDSKEERAGVPEVILYPKNDDEN